MKIQILLLACTATLVPAETVRFKPTESLSVLSEKLAADAGIAEVILEEGVYFGSLRIKGPKGPLLIRAADGAKVVFDGARAVEGFQPHEEGSAVFTIDYRHEGGEYPKFWEPR